MTHRYGWAITALLAITASQSAWAQAVPDDGWAWRATIYGWFPSIKSSTQTFDSGIETEVNPGNYLSNLKFAFMGALEGRSGPWSVVGDVVYLNQGDLKTAVKSITGPAGIVTIPVQANLNTKLEAGVGSFAVGRSIASSAASPMDAIIGTRYTRVKSRVEWEFSGPAGDLPQRGDAEVTKDLWDGVVGLRGRAALGGPWFVPYHLDCGAGSSRFTWQAIGGIGYRTTWGDIALVYRHLEYDFHSDRPMSDLRISGPALGATFQF